MSESKHTPGKLMMSSSFLLVTNEAVVVANTQPIDVGGITTTYDEGEANAERLIKCWNSHDALVAACREIKDISLKIGITDDQPMRDKFASAVVKIEAALELVKKGD